MGLHRWARHAHEVVEERHRKEAARAAAIEANGGVDPNPESVVEEMKREEASVEADLAVADPGPPPEGAVLFLAGFSDSEVSVS